MLRDRNAIKIIAEHWGCSTRTVKRRIADGSLGCLRIGRIVRITREQVDAYELAHEFGQAHDDYVKRFKEKMNLDRAYEMGRRIGAQMRQKPK